jgi:ATP/maltotriose-dependent transcriptional regulator MalT
MATAEMLDRGRRSFATRAWAEAFAQLSAADRESPLDPEDLQRLAVAAYLVGRDGDSAGLWARAYHESTTRGEAAGAARCAFWLGFDLLLKGEAGGSGGWLARAQRQADDAGPDCVEQGYLLVPAGLRSMFGGQPAHAYAEFRRAVEIGARFDDPDLVSLGRLGGGQAMILQGKTAEGVTSLDEAMVAVTAGEVSAIVAGIVYCAVIATCQEIFDVRRAREWTAALTHWCESQPDLVPYRGQCLVHRAEIMTLRGAWADAIDEAQRASERFAQMQDQPAAGAAFYQRAELHRLRGEFAAAEEAYRQASRRGRLPQPGLAQLRLAQGRVEAAYAAIRRVMDEMPAPPARTRLLAAYVEVALAARDVPAARVAADELAEVAAHADAPLLRAVAAHADAAVVLAEGDARAALVALRGAWTAWQELDVPYEAARVRVLVGLACRQLGDADSAEMEFDAARWVFQQLGATPDLAQLDALSRTAPAPATGGLTAREVQVLRLVAAGKTNRAIAADLFLSDRTVARHVSNIFTKLDLSSRSAATAYAYEHGLV